MSTNPQDKMLDDLISGLVHTINSVLPTYNKTGVSSSTTNLTQIATSLINVAKLQQLDRVIEGLLHVYAELIRTHETKMMEYSGSSGSGLSTSSIASGITSTSARVENLLNITGGSITSGGSSGSGNSASEYYEEQEEKFVRSKLVVFQLFNCLLSSAINYDKLDLHFDNEFDDEFQMQHMMMPNSSSSLTDEQVLERNQQLLNAKRGEGVDSSSSSSPTGHESHPSSEQFAIADLEISKFDESKLPKLDVGLAQSLVKYIIDTLYPGLDKEKDKSVLNPAKAPPATLKHLAARVLFKTSVLSFDVVFGRVEEFFKGMKSDEVNISVYNIIEYLNFDKNKLARLFNLLNDCSAKFKKNAALAIVQPLRKAIWNYIVNHPHQFIADCRSMTMMSGNPIKLFYGLAEKTKKMPNIWPLQTMILLLCPKILSDVIMLIKSGKNDSAYSKERKFLENLKTSSKTKTDKADFAAVCFVDLYKASSYLSKTDLGALRFFTSEVQSVMLDRLDNPVKTLDGKPDVSLMVDFLVSAYRVNPRNAVSCIFPNLIKSSSFCKLVMAKAFFILAQEQAPLPWHPTMTESYAHVAKPARFLFQDALQEERNTYQQRLNAQKESQSSSSGSLSVRQRMTGGVKTKEPVEPSYASETLLNLLAAFYLEPLLPLENTAGNDKTHMTDVLYFFHGLTNCLGEKNTPQVQYHAHRLLQRFFNVKYIMQWVPGDAITGFIEISASVIIQLSGTLVEDKDIQGEHIMPILDLVKEITASANRFILQYKDQITEEHINSRKRIQSWESIESSLLVILCSTDVDIWTSAASCFGDLCDQIDILGHRELKANTILTNYMLYRQISDMVANGKRGESQQKSINRLLRRVEVQTKANIAAFIEVFNRWRKYTDTIFKGEMRARENREDTNLNMTKMKAMWKNYTTFLCSIGGVCLQTGDGVLLSKGNHKNTMTEDLIKELMKLLTLDHKYISDNVTRIVGLDLSPGVYGVLFKNLHNTVAQFFGEENSVKVSAVSTLFVDKAINIVKSVLEQAEESSEDLALANFETLIMSFIRYCTQLVGIESVGIKCRLCLLIVTVMSKKEYITFGNEIQFRFNALKYISEWTSEFASSLQDNQSRKKSSEDTELDELCLRAIAALLKHLPLMKIKREKVTAKEKDEMNKREFLKYFHFLSKYLSKSASTSKQQLREYTIISLGNLLESNINYGLEQFMRMTYVEDQETRSAFLAVLTKIVKQGIQLDQAESTEPKEKYERLMNVLMEDKLSLVFLMLKSVSMTEQDELCRSFVKLFAETGQVVSLLRTAIDTEVSQTPQASTLFRANSSASKMLSAFCSLVGKEYMHHILNPLITSVNSDPARYEIDPIKLTKDDDLEANMKHLTDVTQRFIDAIINSVEDCPMSMRVICEYLSSSVESKFPASDLEESTDIGQKPKYVAMGGMLVLRFLNPAVASPKTNGIVDQQPNAQVSRNLILISKLLQNVANGVRFKEDFMKTMDNFIMRNLPRVRDFFDRIGEVYADSDYETTVPMDEESRVENLHILHRFLFTNIDKMRQKATTEYEKDQVEKLAGIIVELGKPPEKEKTTSTYTPSHGEFTNVLFQNFMSQMGTKNPNLSYLEEKQFFYKSGISKEQRPVLYFVARNFEGIDNDEDNENALYYVLKTLQAIFTKPYEIVLDCTEFKEEHGLQFAHFTKLFKLLPDGAKKNVAKIIIFGANSYFKEFVKPVQSRLMNRKNSKKIHFVSTVKEMHAFIDDKNCSLVPDSTSFEDDVQLTISPAWAVLSPLNLKEVVIKLGNKKLCVITKDDTILGLSAKRVDFIDIARISHVKLESNPHDASIEQVVVEYDSIPPKTLVLKSDMNKQLHMGIKASKVRILSELKMAASFDSDQIESRGMTQEDIPGSVLNMCFLNLESKFPQTRHEAYNLLAALAEQFDFPVKLLETANMCVPHNTGDLVVALSEKVAHAKPSLTSQFLTESLRGFNKVSLAYKLLCLKYMKPWIPNLSQEYARANDDGDNDIVEKIREWFPELVKSTMEFPDVYPAMLSELWGEISKEESLVAISMECILSASLESGLGTTKSEILNDLVVTLASEQCSELVVKIILEHAMATLTEEITDGEEPIENNSSWAKMIHCCRFLLVLSFQNRIDVVNNAPSIFFVISMMIGRGSLFVRSTIHALALNLIHSLATALEFSRDQMKLIQSHLDQLNSDRFRIMFIGNTADKTDPFVSLNYRGISKGEPHRPTMSDIQTLAYFIVEVMKTCSLVNGFIQRDWESQYADLFNPTSTLNLVTLPRVLTTFGVMTKTVRETEEYLPFIIDCLMDGFRNYSSSKPDLPVSALLCLSQFCNKLSSDDPLLSKMLLVPLFLMPYCDSVIFPVALSLMDTIVTSLSSSAQFHDCFSIEDYFNKYLREDMKTETFIQRFEKVIGMSLKTHFSFALSSFLIKGLTSSQTRERTLLFLTSMLGISSKASTNKMFNKREDMSELLGLATALAPFKFEEALAIIGIDKHQFYSEETFSHEFSGLLFSRFLLLLSQHVEMDAEKISICNILQDGLQKVPEMFEMAQPDIMPRVVQLYTSAATSGNSVLSETVLSLVNTLMTEVSSSSGNALHKTSSEDALKDILFIGMNRLGSFKSSSEQVSSDCATIMIDYVRSTFPNGAQPQAKTRKRSYFNKNHQALRQSSAALKFIQEEYDDDYGYGN